MSSEKVVLVLKESLNSLFRKPGMLVGGLLLYAVLFLFSTLGGSLAGRFQTTGSNVVWTIVFGIIAISFMSFIFSGMIGIVNEKRKFVENGLKFWKRNFLIIVITLLVIVVVGRIAHYAAFFIGQLLNFGVTSATIFFVLIYFIGLVGILIFLTYASFFVVYEDMNVLKGLKKSKDFVVKNYLETLSVLVILFVIGYLVDMVPGLFGDLITYILLLPLSVFVLGNMVLLKKKK